MPAYIKTAKKVFEYPDAPAARRALPRIRRTDHAAYIVPPAQEFETLKQTPSDQVVYSSPARRGN